MRKITALISLFLLFSCNESKNSLNRSEKSIDTSGKQLSEIKPVVTLTPSNDTDKVSFSTSGQTFTIKYYKNKPQYMLIDNEAIGALTENHFVKDNKGAYLSFDSNNLKAFGVKYLNGHNGVDAIMKPDGSQLNLLKLWTEYSNDGMQYDFSKISQGKVIAYQYKDGNIIDSFTLQRNK